MVERRGGKHLCMMDERCRGLQTVRCFLSLSYAFLIRRLEGGWRVREPRIEDRRQRWNKVRG